ncbi:MAG TPA: signal peptidase I, partial [Thermoanaerobaculia bacterium]
KRVVAVPGDRVSMRGKELFINGQLVKWSDLHPANDLELGPVFTGVEDLVGKHHMVMTAPQVPAHQPFDTIVPPGKYFVMGDNRDNSNDSRYIGFIERRRIIGEATAVAFSLDRKHYWTPRFDRFFKDLE